MTLMMIFGTTKANALSYDYNIGSERQVYTGGKNITLNIADSSLSNGYNNLDVKFDKDNGQYSNAYGSYGYDFPNAKFIRIAYSGALYSYSANNTVINLSETCTQNISGGSQYTITYADGSHATVNLSQYQAYCYNHDISGSQADFNTIISEVQPRVTLVSNGNWQNCEMDNGFILCPVEPNTRYFYLRFNYKTYSISNGSLIKYDLALHASFFEITTDTQAIINNQNQNTQDTIDTITDSNINSSVTTDTNNIGNSVSTDGKNVVLNFLMIPFTFMTNVVNSFDNQCQTICLGNCPSGGGGHDDAFYFVLPCINLQQILGNTIYGIIDALMCVTMIFAFIRSVIKFIQKCLLLEVDVSSEVRMFT